MLVRMARRRIWNKLKGHEGQQGALQPVMAEGGFRPKGGAPLVNLLIGLLHCNGLDADPGEISRD